MIPRIILFFAFSATVFASPVAQNQDADVSFIARGTELLAMELCKNFDLPESAVFSPLGFSALFAIFAEGAKGPSRQEIADSLFFPQNIDEVRTGYRNVLRQFSKHSQLNVPELKNWFYIYKNHSANDNFKQILREFYLTEVKTVDRPQEFIEPEVSENKKLPVGLQGKPVDHLIDVDKQVVSIIENANSPHKSDGEEAVSNNGPALFDASKSKEKLPLEDSSLNEVTEYPTTTERFTEEPTTEATTVRADRQEVMVAMQRSVDHNSPFSINDLIGKSKSSIKISSRDTFGKSQAVVFNGLYFRGNWAVPLTKYPADDSRPFYREDGKKVFVSNLAAEGMFRTAEIPELKAKVLELPYEEGKYSLLLFVPLERDGLKQLSSDLHHFPVSNAVRLLQEKSLSVNLPVFKLTTIGKPVSISTQKLANITKIFDVNSADLSEISNEPGFFVEELVQVVSFKVDSLNAEANFLSASIISGRSDLEKFEVNHPFMFFLRSNSNGIIVVNGHVCDPTVTEEEFRSDQKFAVNHALV